MINAQEDYGVRSDGRDATAALQEAINVATRSNESLFIPSGEYRLSGVISATGNVSIFGESRGSTRLKWVSGGLRFGLNNDQGFSQTCSIQNLSLLTSGIGGTALKVTGSLDTAADRVTPRVVLRDLIIRGVVNPTVDGWGIGIHLSNCSNSVIESVSITGKVGNGEPDYTSDFGIVYDNNGAWPHPAAVAISNSFITYAKKGIYCSDFEGALITSNQIIGTNFGVHVTGPLHYPHASITNNHINSSAICVLVDRMHEVSLHNNLLYKQLGDATTGTGINIINNAGYWSIVGNTFENLSGFVGMNGVIVSYGFRGLINSNIFRRCNSTGGKVNGAGIWMTPGSTSCEAGNNSFYETTTAVIDQGTSNVRG